MTGDQTPALRAAAFEYLENLRLAGHETATWDQLVRGFTFEGERVSLISQRGIHRLRRLGPIPLSISTAPERAGRAAPYEDRIEADGRIRYHYFAHDPEHADNVGLRLACRDHVPLVYFVGIEPGVYAWYPVMIVRDDPASLTVLVEVEVELGRLSATDVGEDRGALRQYVTRAAKRRLHQLRFSCNVLRAYQRRCAMCRLRHVLDAAHILPDHHPRGDPIVPNGLALCRLHHAVFDQHLIGVNPDLKIVVRESLLDEEDGPILEHGLKRLHGGDLLLPRRPELWPDRERVEKRYAMFERAG